MKLMLNKTNIFVIETMQNRSNIILCWETPYTGPAQNKNHNSEHTKLVNWVCVRLTPKLKPTMPRQSHNA